MFVKITCENCWYDGYKAIGKLAEVKKNGNKYELIVGSHNDKLFTALDNIPYHNGRATGCDYRGCWIDVGDCEEFVEINNNKAGKHLLESDY